MDGGALPYFVDLRTASVSFLLTVFFLCLCLSVRASVEWRKRGFFSSFLICLSYYSLKGAGLPAAIHTVVICVIVVRQYKFCKNILLTKFINMSVRLFEYEFLFVEVINLLISKCTTN